MSQDHNWLSTLLTACGAIPLMSFIHPVCLFTSPQACNGYPESGVCDASTWRLLLGQDAQPSIISQLRSGQSDDEDLGEQVGPAGA